MNSSGVSVLFNEPKLLKLLYKALRLQSLARFSALQRAEIAEIATAQPSPGRCSHSFSALQRAEIAEICR